MDKKHEQQIQEDLIVYQLLQKHLEQLTQEGSLLEKRLAEIETTRGTIQDVQKMEKGGEVVFPLGSGCFGYGTVSEKGKLMVEVGAGNLINKTSEEALDFLEARKEEAMKLAGRVASDMSAVSERINEIASKILKESQSEEREHKHG